MTSKRELASPDVKELVKQLDRAVGAAEYVIKICEDDVKAGEDPSPFKKANHSGALAHCYAAMNFVVGARKVLERWKEQKPQVKRRCRTTAGR
jgi:hypothetical protein